MAINSATKLYAVVGYPIGHSQSPLMFNGLFQKTNYNAVYLAFEDKDAQKLFQGIKCLGLSGVSVTIPHKSAMLHFMDELDEMAKILGAINTVHFKNGKFYGYNFDGVACIQALLRKWPKLAFDSTFLILGAGGSAHGIALSLASYKKRDKGFPFQGQIDIAARNLEKARALSEKVQKLHIESQVFALENFQEPFLAYDVIINTTPLGMKKASLAGKQDKKRESAYDNLAEKSALSRNFLRSWKKRRKDPLLYDIVYTPRETKLMRDAKDTGCLTLGGLDMFLLQAAAQFEVWTGVAVSLNEMQALWRKAI